MSETTTRCARGCTVHDKHLPACTCTTTCPPHPDHCAGCLPRPAHEGDLCRGCIQRIHNALDEITTSWDAMMPEPKVGAGSRARTLITHDDDDDRTDDVPHIDAVIDARTPILVALNNWARGVVTGRQLHLPPKGDDVHDMTRFLRRHLDWIAAQEAAPVFYDSIRTLSRDVHRVAYPTRSDFVHLGDCPFVVEDWFCHGHIRSRIGDDLTAACTDCGQEGPVQWWEQVLDITPTAAAVSSTELARILQQRLNVTVSEQTVRRWARDGRITALIPFGPQPRTPRWWFEPRTVLDEVARMDRPCPGCGKPWSGVGAVCASCFTRQLHAVPMKAEPKAKTPAPVRRFPDRTTVVVPDPHDTDRPTRCHWSDLPLDQCACGRPHNLTA